MRCTVGNCTYVDSDGVRMGSAVCDAAVSGLLWRWLGGAMKCVGCGGADTLNSTSSLVFGIHHLRYISIDEPDTRLIAVSETSSRSTEPGFGETTNPRFEPPAVVVEGGLRIYVFPFRCVSCKRRRNHA